MNDDNITLDELFDEDAIKREQETDLQDVHVDQMLWKIGQLESEIEGILAKQEESKEFYDRKIESVSKQIQFRANILNTYMETLANEGKKTIKLPNGTIRKTTRTKQYWGDDDSLNKFSYDNEIPTRVQEKPNKKAILEFIKKSGLTPDGFAEEEETTFTYKVNR